MGILESLAFDPKAIGSLAVLTGITLQTRVAMVSHAAAFTNRSSCPPHAGHNSNIVVIKYDYGIWYGRFLHILVYYTFCIDYDLPKLLELSGMVNSI